MPPLLLSIPVIDQPFSRACVETIDRSLYPHLLVVDNTRRSALARQWKFHGVCYSEHAGNIGVARSWNLALRHALALRYRAVALISAQVRFGAEGGKDLLELADVDDFTAPAPVGWHAIVVPTALVAEVGLFDENFYPAYYEDTDMIRRLALAGREVRHEGTIDAYAGRDGHGVDKLRGEHPGRSTINYDALADYWQAKWGCHVNDCANLDVGYRTPFDDPTLTASDWPPCTIDELRARHGIIV